MLHCIELRSVVLCLLCCVALHCDPLCCVAIRCILLHLHSVAIHCIASAVLSCDPLCCVVLSTSSVFLVFRLR